MVYNPARIAQSYTAGLESGERRKIRGLDQERIRKEEAAKAKTAAQTARIEGLSSQLYLGDEAARGGLMAEGSKGFAAVKDYEEYQLGQTTAKRETETFDREASERELTQSMAQALTITDPAEWEQYEAWARPRSLAAGTSEEMYDQIASMPMAEAQAFLRKQMSGETKAAPSGGIKNVRMPDDSTPSFDITNPEQRTAYQDAIAAGGTDVPSKQLLGEMATGGKPEIRLLNEMAASTNTLTRNLSRAVKTLKTDPESGMIIGDIALFADNMANNLSALVGKADISDAELAADIAEFSGLVEPIAAASSEFNSALIDAAYAKALIQNGSRPTNQDYQAAYKSLTGGSQNPKILIKNLNRASGDLQDDFRFRYRESTGKDWGGKFDTEEKSPKGGDSAARNNLTVGPILEEYKDLNFVKRMFDKDAPTIKRKGGELSTHMMGAANDAKGNWYGFPTIVQLPSGKLKEFKSEDEAFDYARKTGEIIPFGKDKKRALAFGEGSWKDVDNVAIEGFKVPEIINGINTADMPDGKTIRGPNGILIKKGGVWRKQ